MGSRIGAGLAGALACLISEPALGQTVKWEIEDRFRLFSQGDRASRERLAELQKRLGGAEGGLAAHHDLILATLAGDSAASLRRSHYRPADGAGLEGSGRYDRHYLYPEYYTVSVWMEGARPGAQCMWRTPVESRRSPCGDRTSLRIADGAGVSRNDWSVVQPLYVAVDGGPEQQPLTVRFRDRLIVAMGDSYISGEGNPDVPSVITDELDKRRRKLFSRPSWVNKLNEKKGDYRRAIWWDEPCHRSLLSWPVLASLAYSARKADEAITLVHLGCSAATVDDIVDRGQIDLPGGGAEPRGEPQLTQLKDLLAAAPAGWKPRKPDRVLLSIGGNDIGFGGVIATITLPPNGFTLGPPAVRIVGRKGGAVCPYDETGTPLSRLCSSRASAESRLLDLPGRYEALERALGALVTGANIHQFTYPNPLLGEDGKPCHSGYEGERPADSGFNSLMGVVAPIARGFRFQSWNFEIKYDAEENWNGEYLIPGSQVRCDTDRDPSDSEVCQALWVHSKLNEAVRANGRDGRWKVVSSHTGAIEGRGICLADNEFRLALPLATKDGVWKNGWTPRSFRPYDEKLPRWFRVTNDSAVTQYADRDHFYNGTIHPTYQAHLAYAQAALDEALLPGPPTP